MRIISGKYGGRHIESPKGHRTHPMADRVRGGLFNALGDIDGLTVFDAFAGSGALSFEALSRGAKNVLATDVDKNAHNTMLKNAEALGLGKEFKAIRANASGWSDNNPDKTFDLLFIAPPYDNLQPSLLSKLTKHAKAGSLYVLDWPGDMVPPTLDSLELLKQLNYGDAQLAFYRKTE
jgi:16S rRNA (guanine966-N2)-methyltransferase